MLWISITAQWQEPKVYDSQYFQEFFESFIIPNDAERAVDEGWSSFDYMSGLSKLLRENGIYHIAGATEAQLEIILRYMREVKFDICRAYSTPFSYIRGHVWKLVGHWMSEFTDLRDEFVVFKHPVDLDGLTAWGEKMRARIEDLEKTTGRRRPIPKKSERALAREATEEAKRAAVEEAKREEDALRGTFDV